MNIPFLRPEQCVDRIATRVRKRIKVLEETRLAGYEVAIAELRLVLDLLERASRYIVNVSSKIKDQ